MTTHYTSRSAIIEHQRCPRARYLGYHLLGTGVRKVKATIPLATGAHVHDGLADMLRQVMALEAKEAPHKVEPVVGLPYHRLIDVDHAVTVALDGYRAELKDRGLDIELGEDGAYVADEQMAVVEGLLRGFQKRGLGELTDKYETLEVEREDCWQDFVAWQDSPAWQRIDLQARADALLRERTTGDLYILSFKTAASKDWRQDSDNRHDVQGLSEAAVVERRLRQWWDCLHQKRPDQTGSEQERKDLLDLIDTDHPTVKLLLDMPDPPRLMGIQMVYLYKGRRAQKDDAGPWLTESPLIRGWTREGVTDRDYAWRYKWDGPDTWPDSGKLRGHTLGKGWSRFDAWTATGGVKAWIDLLASGAVQPDIGRDALADTYAMPLPIFRQDRDMADWVEQAQEQERRVIQDMVTLEQIRAIQRPDAVEKFRRQLNALAPQYRRSCDFPSPCQFQSICFGDESMLSSPYATGLFQPRVAHHTPEAEAQARTVEANSVAPSLRGEQLGASAPSVESPTREPNSQV